MKVKLEIESCDSIVIAVLRRSKATCLKIAKRNGVDKAYAKKYAQAVDFVLRHFEVLPHEK